MIFSISSVVTGLIQIFGILEIQCYIGRMFTKSLRMWNDSLTQLHIKHSNNNMFDGPWRQTDFGHLRLLIARFLGIYKFHQLSPIQFLSYGLKLRNMFIDIKLLFVKNIWSYTTLHLLWQFIHTQVCYFTKILTLKIKCFHLFNLYNFGNILQDKSF
jgi:hypothetical protein